MFKKGFAILVCLCLLQGSLFVFSSANGALPDFDITKAAWDAGWNGKDTVNTNAALTPGRDASELNLAWHSAINAPEPFVNWSDNPAMSGAIAFTGTFAKADGRFRTNRVTVTGLEENRVYYYTYGTGSEVYGPFLYRTLSTETFKFMYINDLHAGYSADDPSYSRDRSYKIHTTLANALKANPDISFCLTGGDNTNSGQMPEEWNSMLAAPVFRTLPTAFAIGNHDKKGEMQKFYVNNPNEYPMRTPSKTGKDFWFRYGEVLFLFIDSTNGNGLDHLNFIKGAVNQNLDAKWRVGILHHDIYGPTPSFVDLDHNLVKLINTTLIDRAGLDVLLNGHSHIYGRSHHLTGGKITDWAFDKESVDPKGTVYISMSAVNNVASSAAPWANTWTAKRANDAETIYSTFEVKGDSLIYKAFYYSGRQADEYTITKTADDGVPFMEPAGFDFYKIVGFGGMIYALVDSISNEFPAQ